MVDDTLCDIVKVKNSPTNLSFEQCYRVFYNYWMNSTKRTRQPSHLHMNDSCTEYKTVVLLNTIQKKEHLFNDFNFGLLKDVMLYILRNDPNSSIKKYLDYLEDKIRILSYYENDFCIPRELWVKIINFYFRDYDIKDPTELLSKLN